MKTKLIIIYFLTLISFIFTRICVADRGISRADSGVSNGCRITENNEYNSDKIRDGINFALNMMNSIHPDDIKSIYNGLNDEGKALASMYEKNYKSMLKEVKNILKKKHPPTEMFPVVCDEPELMAKEILNVLIGKRVPKTDYKPIGSFILMLYDFKKNSDPVVNHRDCKES